MKDILDNKLEEFKANLKESVNDRISNPFFLVFASLLVLYNWDIILLIILSKKDISNTILEVKSLLNTSTYYHINLRVISPLLWGIFSYIIFKGIYFLYGKYFTTLETGIIKAHYNKIDEKVKGERTVFESKLGIKEIQELNDKIVTLEEDNTNKQILIEKERKAFSEINDEYSKLNSSFSNLQNENTANVKRIAKLEQENSNIDRLNEMYRVLEQENNRLNNIIKSYNNIDDYEKLINAISDIIFSNLNLPKTIYNGDFNLIQFIMDELINIGYFNSSTLRKILIEGLKNVYFESKIDFISIIEDFSDQSYQLNENITGITNSLIDYLQRQNVIIYDKDLSESKNDSTYHVSERYKNIFNKKDHNILHA